MGRGRFVVTMGEWRQVFAGHGVGERCGMECRFMCERECDVGLRWSGRGKAHWGSRLHGQWGGGSQSSMDHGFGRFLKEAFWAEEKEGRSGGRRWRMCVWKV